MRLSIAYDEDGSFLVASSGNEEEERLVQPVETGDLFVTNRPRDTELNDAIDGPNDDMGATQAEILIAAPSGRLPWRFLTLAALALVAAIALRLWLPSTSPKIETDPIAPPTAAAVPPWAPAEPLHLPPVPDQANASWTAATVGGPTANLQFCWNSPSLCDQVTPARPNAG
jgi:hypothetical protein